MQPKLSGEDQKATTTGPCMTGQYAQMGGVNLHSGLQVAQTSQNNQNGAARVKKQ